MPAVANEIYPSTRQKTNFDSNPSSEVFQNADKHDNRGELGELKPGESPLQANFNVEKIPEQSRNQRGG